MTNQEAIRMLIRLEDRLNWEVTDSQKKMDALEMAIKALETHEERTEDEEVITLRKGTLKAVTGRFVVYDRKWLKEHFNTTEAYLYGGIMASDVSDANAGDLISRQAVIDTIETDCSWTMFDEWGNHTPIGECINEAIKRVPSVEPERKTGKWVLLSDDEVKKGSISWLYCSTAWINYKCSSCGKIVHNRLMGHEENRTRYCPCCGAKMEVKE